MAVRDGKKEVGDKARKQGAIRMEVYFDNAATTRVMKSAADMVLKVMTEDYANPSARHRKGMEAESHIRKAAETIAGTLKVEPKEIIFTSGGTESNNMALMGGTLANRRAGSHVITTGVEHPSVYNPLGYLADQGFEITYLPVDEAGHVSPRDLAAAMREETILVSVMYVNNEVGALEPVEELSKVVKERNPHALFHVDAIQAYGKYVIRPKRQGIDLMSVSGHKLHAPKGVGFLYAADGVKLKPLIYGGGQQRNLRSGTENVPGIAGLGVAAGEMYAGHEEKVARLCGLKDYMMEKLQTLEGITVNSLPGCLSAPHILSVSFEGVRGEVLLHSLEEKGIYVSSGSACSSNHPAASKTLKAVGVKPLLLASTLRFSFGLYNAREEVDYCVSEIERLLPVLRKYQRG